MKIIKYDWASMKTIQKEMESTDIGFCTEGYRKKCEKRKLCVYGMNEKRQEQNFKNCKPFIIIVKRK